MTQHRPKLLTTSQTCTLLGVHETTLWRWRNSGQLMHARRDRHGHYQYDRDTVERFRLRRSRRPSHHGVTAADVYEMFAHDHSDSEIVRALRVSPAKVQELREQYASPGGWLVPPCLRKQLDELLDGYGLPAPATPEELYAIITRTLEMNALLNHKLLAVQDTDKTPGKPHD